MNDTTLHTIVLASRPVRYAATAALTLLAIFLFVLTWHTAFGRQAGDPVNTITVQGTGTAATAPDIAEISYTVTESAPAVADAQSAATKKSNDALAAVKKLGVADKDIQTASYSVSPKYDYGTPSCGAGVICPMMVSQGSAKIVGYDVSQTVTVKVRDTSKAGDVLQALGTLGVQNIQGPNFTVDNDDAVTAQAREMAIAEARAKAKTLAGQLGVHLGRVVSYSEGGSYPQPVMYAMDKAAGSTAASAPTLATGENDSTISVSVTYEIQ